MAYRFVDFALRFRSTEVEIPAGCVQVTCIFKIDMPFFNNTLLFIKEIIFKQVEISSYV